MTEPPLLTWVAPELALRMEERLRAQGETILADQVAEVRVVAACTCGQPYCGSFYTTAKPIRRWFARGRRIELRGDLPGEVVVDVVRGAISYVEVLHWDEVRDAVQRAARTAP